MKKMANMFTRALAYKHQLTQANFLFLKFSIVKDHPSSC